jgi:hypothetical protein
MSCQICPSGPTSATASPSTYYALAGEDELDRTRRALAQLVDVLITRGVLTEADTHVILSRPGSA